MLFGGEALAELVHQVAPLVRDVFLGEAVETALLEPVVLDAVEDADVLDQFGGGRAAVVIVRSLGNSMDRMWRIST